MVELPTTVLLNNKGLTLVELMIALVILLLVSLALMQTALVGIDSNMRNVLRDEAVRIAEMRMEQARNLTFTQSSTNLISDTGLLAGDCPTGFPATGVLVERDVRSVDDFNFCTNMTVQEIGGDAVLATPDSDNRRVNITVGWRWQGADYRHAISTVIRKKSG